MKNKLRKLLNSVTGFDIVRYGEKKEPLLFLKDFNIQTVIDIGANVGQFALETRKVLKEAHIHSFEPLNGAFGELNKAFTEDSCFSSYNFALGDIEQKTFINKNDYLPSSSLMDNSKANDDMFPFTRTTEKEEVTIKVLDSILDTVSLKKNILLKLDVQGYEDKVLNGARKILGETSVVLVETSFLELYKGQLLFSGIYERLTEEGFLYFGSLNRKHNPENMLPVFEDSIFIHKSLIKN